MSRFLTGLLASLVLLTGNAPAVAQSISGFGGGSSLATPVSTLNGGTGAALTPVIGDILAADSTTSFARIAAPAVGQVLTSNGVGVAPSWSGTLNLSGNGALSAPAITGYGTWITGGTSTTTKPYALIEPTGTTSTAWSTSGTGLGVNAASGFTGNLLDLQLNGATRLKVASDGSLTSMGSLSIAGGSFIAFGGAGTYLDTPSNGNLRVNNNSGANSFTVSAPVASASATFQHGALDAAAPVAQTIKFQDVVAGTSNTAGVNATIQAPAGTGTGAGGSLIFQVAPTGSSGSAKNAWATALTIDSTKLATFGGGVTATGNVTAAYFRNGANQFHLYGTAGGIELWNSTETLSFALVPGASNLATFNGPIKALTTTVASLPAAGTIGRLAYVTDALAPTFLATVVGGGSVKTPVHDDGTNWVVG